MIEEAGKGEGGLFGGRLPIVIGVTGRRDLGEREDAIARTVASECRKLRSRYPDSPFLVLSGLAEGADRLVAGIVMRELDARLCAVLPLPPENYVKDFADEASRAAFHELLAKAALRADVYDEMGADEWSAPGKQRDRQYARQGGLIAEQAQILFAVWDGQRSRGPGGTGDVAKWFMRGYPPKDCSAFPDDITPLDPSEPGLLIQIDPATAEVVDRPSKQEKLSSDIRQILERTERFNREIQRIRRPAARDEPLLPAGKTPADAPREAAATYCLSNALAIHYRNKARRADAVVYSLGLLAVFFFDMINDWPAASWAYLAATGVIAVCLIYLSASSIDPRATEYRGVAEAARVLFFWRLVGIRRPIWLSYLADRAGVVHWVRHAVRALELCEDSRKQAAEKRPESLEIVTEFWVRRQIDYYNGASCVHWRQYKRWMLIARAAFGFSFAAALLLSLAAYYSLSQDGPGDAGLFRWPDAQFPLLPLKFSDVTEWLQMALGLLAAAAIAARAFLARRADLELTKQFASTEAIFKRALRNLEEARSAGKDAEWTPEEILEKLGREALFEHAEWLWVRHARPFEMLN
jgi:hypothetical protein